MELQTDRATISIKTISSLNQKIELLTDLECRVKLMVWRDSWHRVEDSTKC